MSLALAMSTNLNRDICVDMAVSSKIENVTNAAPLHQHTTVFHNHDGEHCCGLPYQDHNYGAPPPPPTPPLSPNEACFKPLMTEPKMMCVNSCPSTVSPPPSVPNTIPYQNGLEDTSQDSTSLCPNSVSPESGLDITRCICGFTHDDGYMICCDQCSVWQHIDCMNIDRNNIPDTYLCDKCNPRHVDKEQAVLLQSKKKDDLSMTSELDSDIESGDEISAHGEIQYTSVQSTPTSLTITSNRNGKKSFSILGSGKKRKRSKDDSKKAGKRFHGMDKKARPRSRSKSSCQDPSHDELIGCSTYNWEARVREWSSSYQDMDSSNYTPEVLHSVVSASKKLNEINHGNSILNQLHEQLAKVQHLKNCVLAMEDIGIAMPVAEVKGNYMLSNQFEGSNPILYKRPYPYVFFYTGFDGLEICVDARLSGNVTRYMRRSCQPNCEVKHIMENDRLQLFVFSKEHIASGEEITIPFDFKYQNCAYNVECSCKNPETCPVFKSSKLKAELLSKNGNKLCGAEEFGKKKLSSVFPYSNINGNGYNSSDHESSHSYGDAELDDNNRSENQRKKSREERKMEAYIRAFAKMEKQEKKKELNHNQHPSIKTDPPTPTKEIVKTPVVANVVGEMPEEYFTPSHNVTPNRRTNRRRSTRGGRRNVKRGRMTSFEGVLSPGLAMETDSNHSSDNLVPALNASDRVTSVDSEQSNLSSGNMVPDIIDETTQFFEPGNEPGEFQGAARISESSDVVYSEESKLSQDVDLPQFATAMDEQTYAVGQQQPASVAKVCENSLISTETTNSSMTEQPQTTVSTNTSSKASRNRKHGSSEGHNAASTCGRVSMPPSDSIPLCSFRPWDFRPGVPSGHVKISVSSQRERRCFFKPETYIKKLWLRKAIEEDLLPKESTTTPQNDAQNVPEIVNNAAIHSYKKQMLKHYTSASVGDVQQQHPPSPLNDRPDISEMSDNAASHPAPVEAATSTLPAENTGVLDNNEPSTSNCVHRVLEYENLSDDDENKISQDINNSSAQTTVCNSSECPPNMSNWSENEEAPGKILNNENMVLLEEAQTAPTKKKVSLQEYLKRSKDVRKSSVDAESTVSIKQTTSTLSKASDSTNSVMSNNKTMNTVLHINRSPAPSAAVKHIVRSPSESESNKESMPIKESVENLAKIITEVVKPAAGNNQAKLSNLSSALSTGAIKTLPEEVMKIVTKTVKELSTFSEDSENHATTKNASVKSSDTAGPRLKRGSKASPATTGNQGSQNGNKNVARSNSSGTSHRPRSGSSGSDTRKKSSVPSTQTHSGSATKPLHSQSSPVTPRSAPSPRSPQVNTNLLKSPSTPTVYDHRRSNRNDFSKEHTSASSRSRHNSGASSGSGSTMSTKSPRPIPTTDYHKHSTHSGSSNSYKHDSHSRSSSNNQPQKVPSLSPAVPGQPIPSLIRGPGSAVPQVVYNNRPAPTSSRLSQNSPPPPWDDYRPGDHLDRPPKEPPYSRSAYYPPSGPDSVGSGYRRNSYDKPYYDRYPYPYARRDEPREEYPPPKHSPPPPSFYHQSSYYLEGKVGYYPPRDQRPISPVPHHRHRPPDYYAPKRKGDPCYRANFYAPDLHRR